MRYSVIDNSFQSMDPLKLSARLPSDYRTAASFIMYVLTELHESNRITTVLLCLAEIIHASTFSCGLVYYEVNAHSL